MASRITKVNEDFNTALSSILVDGKPLFKYINIWNDQIDRLIVGGGYPFGMPAAFIELDLGESKDYLMGVSVYPEARAHIHLVNQVLHAGGVKMDANYQIFEIRDKVKSKLHTYRGISFCTTLTTDKDKFDYNHNNVYKYILSFKFVFTDVAGSIVDPSNGITWGYIDDISLNIFFSWLSGKNYITINGTIYYKNENGQIYENEDGEKYIYIDDHALMANVVSYQNEIYICIEDNNDNIFDPEKWIKVDYWIIGKEYIIDDYVYFESHIYKCKTVNSDTVFDPVNWHFIIT